MLTAADWREALLKGSLDAVVLMDAQGRLVDFNAEAERLFLLTSGALGQLLGDLIVPADLRERHRAGLARFLSTGESRIIGSRIEIDAQRTDGYRFPVELTIASIQDDPPLFVAHLRDIQEQKFAERRLIAMAAVGKVLSTSKDADDAIEGVLKALGESLRWPIVTFWDVDRTRRRLVRRHSWVDASCQDLSTVDEGAEFEHGQGLPGATWASATPQWIEPTMRPLKAQGIETGLAFPVMLKEDVVAVIEAFAPERWVTQPELLAVLQAMGRQLGHFLEELHARAETERARREAEHANQLKDEFLSVASHELRTPLNAVLGWVHLLRKGRLTGEAAERAMETIERNVMVQSRLVGDLMDMSRIIAGKFNLELALLDARAPILAAVDVVRPAADAKRIAITVGPAGPERLQLRGDSGRLQQVFWNLLSNAVKFTPVGGAVDVSISRDHDHARIAVVDTGIGIPDDFAPRAFDRFAQADQQVGRGTGGLGLGLSIARQFVELHGGTITLDSAGTNHGTTVTVRLPLAGSTADAAPDPAIIAPDRDLVGVRVLIASDDQDTSTDVRVLLEMAGASVEEAASPEEALGCISRSSFHVLISHFRQPETSLWLGRELAAQPPPAADHLSHIAVLPSGMVAGRLADVVMHDLLDPSELRRAVADLVHRA